MTSSDHKQTSETSPITTLVNDDDDDDDNLQSDISSSMNRPPISTSLSGSTSTEVDQEQIDHIRDAFTVFDKNMTGSITTEQFRKVLEGLGYNVPEAEITTFIKQLDIDKSGTIEFDEYLNFMLTFIKKNMTTEYNLQDAFDLFDQDGDGFITATDLRDIMTNLGEKITDEDIDEMIREADIGKDLKVNFYEFQRIMSFK